MKALFGVLAGVMALPFLDTYVFSVRGIWHAAALEGVLVRYALEEDIHNRPWEVRFVLGGWC